MANDNLNDNPVPGAFELITKKKKKTQLIVRGELSCTCGALNEFYSSLYFLHDKKCIINKKMKRSKK